MGDATPYPDAGEVGGRLDLSSSDPVTANPGEKRSAIDPRAKLISMLSGVFYDTAEVAAIFRVNRVTVLSSIDAGWLPAFDVRSANVPRKLWRIRVSDLIRFTKSRVVDLPLHLQSQREDRLATLFGTNDFRRYPAFYQLKR